MAHPAPPRRDSYRHGDLRSALLEAGLALARAGGPDAVVLREATRRAGEVPNAAYRHFPSRQSLLQAVRAAALSALAQSIEAEFDTFAATNPTARARGLLRAVGTGYLRFATAEPGLFRTAFCVPDHRGGTADASKSGDSGLNPFQLLGAALDALVAAGALPAARRPGAEHLAWSAVHGLAMLAIDGPLRDVDGPAVLGIGQRLLDMVERGI